MIPTLMTKATATTIKWQTIKTTFGGTSPITTNGRNNYNNSIDIKSNYSFKSDCRN